MAAQLFQAYSIKCNAWNTSDQFQRMLQYNRIKTLECGDFVKIVNVSFLGYYAMILDCSYGDEWEVQYSEIKYGKWVLQGGDLDSREPSDDTVKVDGRGQYTFSS